MLSRRGLIAVVSSVTVTGIAGCSGSETGGSDTTDCQTRAINHGEGTVLDSGAMARVEDGDVRLAVPLSTDDVGKNDVNRLELYDPVDTLAYAIPVSTDDAELMENKRGVSEGQLLYEQSLGHRPFHGQYRIVAVNTTGEPVDFVTVEFNCFPDVSD
jgi:hypothetical protein